MKKQVIELLKTYYPNVKFWEGKNFLYINTHIKIINDKFLLHSIMWDEKQNKLKYINDEESLEQLEFNYNKLSRDLKNTYIDEFSMPSLSYEDEIFLINTINTHVNS